MGIIDVGTILRLNDGTTAVVTRITDGAILGIFYTVMSNGVIKEISESQVAEVIEKTDQHK